jgi:hypothetical protein
MTWSNAARMSSSFRGGEQEPEVLREALGIALDGLVENASLDAVDSGQLAIEQHPVAAQDEDGAANVLDGHRDGAFRLGHL